MGGKSEQTSARMKPPVDDAEMEEKRVPDTASISSLRSHIIVIMLRQRYRSKGINQNELLQKKYAERLRIAGQVQGTASRVGLPAH